MKPQAETSGLGLNEPATRDTVVPCGTSTSRGTSEVFLMMLTSRATCSAVTDAVSGGLNDTGPILMLAAVNIVPAGVESDRKLTCPPTSQTPSSRTKCVTSWGSFETAS